MGVVVVFPALRLRGDYLAIITLGFAEDHPRCPGWRSDSTVQFKLLLVVQLVLGIPAWVT